MPRKRYTPEQIINSLREAEVLISQGSTAKEASRHLGISEQTYYKWRKEYGGMRIKQAKRSHAVTSAINKYSISQRRAYRTIKQNRATQRYKIKKLPDEDSLTNSIISLVTQYGRYGTPRITAMLHRDGIKVNHKRVERIWREQGLKVARRQKKRRRLWLNDGSCIRLRPEHRDHVWSYDILEDKTYNGRKFRILNIMDEYSRECLLSFAARRITSSEVVEFLADLFCSRGLPEYIRSDNGSEFTAKKVRKFISNLDTLPAFIEPGSPWENGYIESFNLKDDG